MLFSHKTQSDGWTCLCFIHPCIFSLIQDSIQEEREGEEDPGGSSVGGGSKEEYKCLSVRVTIEMQYTLLRLHDKTVLH